MSKAAGIITVSHFSPAINTNMPSRIKAAVATIDFFVFVLMTLLQYPSFELIEDSSVHLFLVALEADAGHSQADHGESRQNFPVSNGGFIGPRSDNAKGQLR